MARSPSIPTPRALDLRNVQSAVDNIRERFASVEKDLDAVQSSTVASDLGRSVKILQQQVSAIAQQLNQVQQSAAVQVLAKLLTMTNGIVVLKDGTLITRLLLSDDSISISTPDGSTGDFIIKIKATSGAPVGDGWLWEASEEVDNSFAEML